MSRAAGTFNAGTFKGTAKAIVLVEAEVARSFVAGLMQASGLSESDARTVAECLVRADLKGVETHGLPPLA
jgi:LDH2 family malate/lactate/ureidoglycolate dehydrogenase